MAFVGLTPPVNALVPLYGNRTVFAGNKHTQNPPHPTPELRKITR